MIKEGRRKEERKPKRMGEGEGEGEKAALGI